MPEGLVHTSASDRCRFRNYAVSACLSLLATAVGLAIIRSQVDAPRSSSGPVLDDGIQKPNSRQPGHVPSRPSAHNMSNKPRRRSFAARAFPWLLCMIASASVLLVLFGVISVLAETSLGVTSPWPAAKTGTLMPGVVPWVTDPHSGAPSFVRGVSQADLTVEITSIDVANRAVSSRVSLVFPDELVNHLRFRKSLLRSPVPLTDVPQDQWAQLPVGIQLTDCRTSIATPGGCGVPVATVPLGQLLILNGALGSVFGSSQSSVSIPAWCSPNRFPSDSYQVSLFPEVTLPGEVFFPTREGGQMVPRWNVPIRLTLAADAGLSDHTVTVSETGSSYPLILGIIFGRPMVDRLIIYTVAFLPLLLAIAIAHLWLRIPGSPKFDLGFLVGLIAAMFAILPLRAVLVPHELDTVSLTLVDDILVLDVLLIATFLFAQYARSVSMATRAAVEKKTQGHSEQSS